MSEATHKKVIEANIDLHSRLANDYNQTEPHFRPENVNIVDKTISELFTKTRGQRLLDIGCGTGYFHELLRKNKIYLPLPILRVFAQ